MKITAIILAHYKEREKNLTVIIDDLLGGVVPPDNIIVFIDNLDIKFNDNRVTVVRSSTSFLPIVRFALGAVSDSDYCFFIDDDLTVQEKTLDRFTTYASLYPDAILGLEGSILSDTPAPYSRDKSIKRRVLELVKVDIIIRTYFVPTHILPYGLQLRTAYPELPKESLDDVFLCLGNKYLNRSDTYVIPVDEKTDLIELPDGGVGQSLSGNHYGNRDKVCRKLMDIYE